MTRSLTSSATTRAALAAGLLAVLAGPAFGAGKAPDPGAAYQAILACRAMPATSERWPCYDRAVEAFVQAQQRGELMVVDRGQATAAHREAFGLPLPSLSFLDRAVKAEEVEDLDATVSGLRRENGRWVATLDTGAVWRQIDGRIFLDPRVGSKVRIRRGALGSFSMAFDNQAPVKAHRDR